MILKVPCNLSHSLKLGIMNSPSTGFHLSAYVKKFYCFHTSELKPFQFHSSRMQEQALGSTGITFWSLLFSSFKKFISIMRNLVWEAGSNYPSG